MREIHGIAGCNSCSGSKELEDGEHVAVRIIDASDGGVAIRIGTHPMGARLTPDEARHIAKLLVQSAQRVERHAHESGVIRS